jgi:DNA-binding FadR family transcriptional regulator
VTQFDNDDLKQGSVSKASVHRPPHAEALALAVWVAYVRNGMNLTRRLSLARKRKRQLLVQNEHLEIAQSIIKQDEDAARMAMRIHIDNARKRALDDSIELS